MNSFRLERRGIRFEPIVQEKTAEVLRLRATGPVTVFDMAGGAGTASFVISMSGASQQFAGTACNSEGFVGLFPIQLDRLNLSDTEIATVSGGEPGFERRPKLTDLARLRPISITAAAVHLEFGSRVPVSVSAGARGFLARLPWPALSLVLDSLRAWARDVALKAVRASVVTDPEADDWQEVVLELLLDAETETALKLWDDLETALATAKEGLAADQRSILDRHLAVHLLWGADSWHDQPSDDAV